MPMPPNSRFQVQDSATALSERARETGRLIARVTELERGQTLEHLIEIAAGHLPAGLHMTIHVENGYGCVELFDADDEKIEYPCDHERIRDQFVCILQLLGIETDAAAGGEGAQRE